MTSTMYVYDDGDGGRQVAGFKMPVKAVFGRMFCDTDGSIGYSTPIDAKQMLDAVAECLSGPNQLDFTEKRDLERLRLRALKGHDFLLDWEH